MGTVCHDKGHTVHVGAVADITVSRDADHVFGVRSKILLDKDSGELLESLHGKRQAQARRALVWSD